MALDSLGGAGNLAYKISHIKGCICLCHVFLDHDRPGKDAHSKAKARGLIEDCDVNYASCAGLSESELEDLYEVSFYKDLILNKYRVSLESPKFKSKKKWSDRLRECFIGQGKNWDDDVKIEVKLLIAKAVESDPGRALNQYKKSVFDALTSALEARLKDKNAEPIA
ncbi:MAG: hypothetical protein QME83_12105 [Thermodesulfobacteriota bacterium]|nr:hypothetical protein [Thermodesulfobacteriota bacterium]